MNDKNNDKLKNSRVDDSNVNEINYNSEIDEEVANSIKKLVEEETNVARAYIDSNVVNASSGSGKRNYVAGTGPKNNAMVASMKTQVIPQIPEHNVAVEMGKTQVINKDEIAEKAISSKEENQEDNENRDYTGSFEHVLDDTYDEDEDVFNTTEIRTYSPKGMGTLQTDKGTNMSKPKDNAHKQGNTGGTKKNQGKRKLTRKTKLLIAGIVALAVLLIAGCITLAVIFNINNKKSYNYNYTKGMELHNSNNDQSALTYLVNALKTNEGSNNIDLMYTIYECYSHTGDDADALAMLKRIISSDKYNEKGLKELGKYYYAHADGNSLNELITNYQNTDGEKYIQEYEVSEPVPSDAAGEYKDTLQLKFIAGNAATVYYTTDGSDPTDKSNKYTDAIVLNKGTTVVKAIAVSAIGVNSSIVELKYVVDYKQPDAPQINPESGTYDSGQMITIDNIADGDTAYYTMDGSSPTAASSKYTGPIAMPEGNTVVSAIIISQHDMTSSVTRRNYVVSVSKTYTFDEAVTILKNRMITLNVLKADGATTTDGGTASFVYQSKKTINNVEMYYVRYDVKKNGVTSTAGYYGIGLKNGQSYKVTESSGNYTADGY